MREQIYLISSNVFFLIMRRVIFKHRILAFDLPNVKLHAYDIGNSIGVSKNIIPISIAHTRFSKF